MLFFPTLVPVHKVSVLRRDQRSLGAAEKLSMDEWGFMDEKNLVSYIFVKK